MRLLLSVIITAALGAPFAAAEQPKPKIALHVSKAITCAGDPIVNATILIADGKIQAIGPRDKVTVPAGYEVIDHSDKFAMPGCIDAHSHVGGTGPDGSRDINEMVYQTNPELRVLDVIRPNNEALKTAVAGGVTTITFIPGSGTNMGGWGALMKTGPGKLDDVLIRFPGVLKIAQAGNPERQGGEVGSGRMGMNYVIRDQLREGMGYTRDWDAYEAGNRSEKPATNLRLEYFKPLFRRQIPVVVHTQGYQVIMSTLRILHDEMHLKVVIDHGCFDSNVLSPEILKRGIPVMAGPRGFRYDAAIGRIKGQVAGFADGGIKALGVNTDAPVVPQEELPFQATMAVRLGWNDEAAIRGLTIEPAKALMIDKRVGSLEVGKDADIVILTGSILDPRQYVVQVLIDGSVAYDIKKDRRRF
jgi:imidazolonepropionase-like amidohydrolase